MIEDEVIFWIAIVFSIVAVIIGFFVFAYNSHIRNIDRDNYLVNHCQVLKVETSTQGYIKEYKCKEK